MKKFLLLAVCVAMATMMLAQTQKGYVKTKGRLGTDGQLIPGEPLGEVTVKVKDRNAVMSDKRGDFSFPMPDETYYLESVTKSGYVMIDPEMLSKQYSYSKNKLVIALETRENQLEERMDMNEKIMRAQKELIDKLRAEVKQLKADNKITEEEYYKRLQEIVDMQNENRQLVDDLVEYYSKIDYDDMNGFDRLFSSYLLNGDLRKADSLLNTKGDLTKRKEDYNQLKEANAKAREDLDMRRKRLEKSEAAAIQMRDDLASDYYKKFEILKMQHKNDSAAYWLEERVKLDTTNMDWIYDAGEFFRVYIADYDKAMEYFRLELQQSLIQYGGNSAKEALSCGHLGNVCIDKNDFPQALELLNKALDIYKEIYGDYSEKVVARYNNLGVLYAHMNKDSLALEYYVKSLNIKLSLYEENSSQVATTYKNIASVYVKMHDYKKALELYNKVLRSSETLRDENPFNLAIFYNNLGVVYNKSGNRKESIEYYEKALDLLLTIVGENHPSVANIYNNIGVNYNNSGEHRKALEYFEKAAIIYESIFGGIHKKIAALYYNMGVASCDIDDYYLALDNLNKAVAVYLSLYGDNNVNIAMCYNVMGRAYRQLGQTTLALEYYYKSLNMFKEICGENHPNIVWAYSNIALAYKEQGIYTKALEYYELALKTNENPDVKNKTGIMTIYNTYSSIGEVYALMQHYSKAREFYNHALTISETEYGPDDSRTTKTREKISEIQSKLAESGKK